MPIIAPNISSEDIIGLAAMNEKLMDVPTNAPMIVEPWSAPDHVGIAQNLVLSGCKCADLCCGLVLHVEPPELPLIDNRK
jgi:hypothetical protein